MSIKAMSMVWERSKQSGSALLMLLAIADYAKDDGTDAWPSLATLARKTRMTRRNAIEIVKKLEEDGELMVRRGAGPRGCNFYDILFPSEVQFTTKKPKQKVVKPSSPALVNPTSPEVVKPSSPVLVNRDSPEPSCNRHLSVKEPLKEPSHFDDLQEADPNDLPHAADNHQRCVDEANGGNGTDPSQEIAKHLYWGFERGPCDVLEGKTWQKWRKGGERLLKRLPRRELSEILGRIDDWFADTDSKDSFWHDNPLHDTALDIIARYVKNGGNRASTNRRDDKQRDPGEKFLDPGTGQFVRRDPATGDLVPVS